MTSGPKRSNSDKISLGFLHWPFNSRTDVRCRGTIWPWIEYLGNGNGGIFNGGYERNKVWKENQ